MTNQNDLTQSTLYLWPLRTLYVGHIHRLSQLSQGAHAVLYGLDKDIQIRVGEHVFSSRSFLVPAGVRYTGESFGQRIGCCFLDPLGRDFLFHKPLMKNAEAGIFFNSSREHSQLVVLDELHQHGVDAAAAYRLLIDELFPGAETHVEGFKEDRRIVRVVELIRSDPTENISNDDLGAQVGLSGARLQRLFKQATGIPIRRYRLWHRLFVTSSMMAMGSTLTDAGLAAGFSDSSHLNHVFKDMLGTKPSTILRRSRSIRILVGSDT